MRRPIAIWEVYAQTNALTVPCGHCSAPAGTFCSLPDGRGPKDPLRVPCGRRRRAGPTRPTGQFGSRRAAIGAVNAEIVAAVLQAAEGDPDE